MSSIGRRFLVRCGLVLLWGAAGFVIFLLYRGHTLVIDNRNGDLPHLKAPDLITVSIDGGAKLEFLQGEYDRLEVKGSNHRILIEFSDGAPAFEQRFTLPIKNDAYMLSIPKMLNRIEPFVEALDPRPEFPESLER
jgi:hypothetical protein